MTPLHHRMPVVLDGDGRDRWLDPAATAEALLELVRPCPNDYLTGYRVSTRVNVPSADGPELLEPVEPMELPLA
jgi:putative SOS response-associated peptidase YedK